MKQISNMMLKVELFAGTEIGTAAHELCELANRVGILCAADFNGVQLWARIGDDWRQLEAAYFVALKGAHSHKIAQVAR